MSQKTIKEQIQEEVKIAMRAQEKERLLVLRSILAEFKRIEIDSRTQGTSVQLEEAQELAVLDRMLKQRRESIAQFTTANRQDLVGKEEDEMKIIQSFMPQPLNEQQVKDLIQAAIIETAATSAKDMGKVMAVLKPKLQGRADLTQVSAQVKTLLTAAN